VPARAELLVSSDGSDGGLNGGSGGGSGGGSDGGPNGGLSSTSGETGSDSDTRSHSDSPRQGRRPLKRRRLAVGDTVNVLPAVQRDVALVHSGELDVDALRGRFTRFLLARGTDIIGEGTYRRFILKNKNAGEEWAHQIHYDIQHTQQLFRAVVKQVQLLQGNPLALKLFAMCQRVMQDTHPPAHCADHWRLCALTGQRTEETVCLGVQGKSDCVYVHHKFFRFFSSLWLVSRMDNCVRNLVHYWLKQDAVRFEKNDYDSIARLFHADSAFHDRVARCFCHSLLHVSTSVDAHAKYLSSSQNHIIKQM
jgi:hypothetical protein